jgi:hypothetical protein
MLRTLVWAAYVVALLGHAGSAASQQLFLDDFTSELRELFEERMLQREMLDNASVLVNNCTMSGSPGECAIYGFCNSANGPSPTSCKTQVHASEPSCATTHMKFTVNGSRKSADVCGIYTFSIRDCFPGEDGECLDCSLVGVDHWNTAKCKCDTGYYRVPASPRSAAILKCALRKISHFCPL